MVDSFRYVMQLASLALRTVRIDHAKNASMLRIPIGDLIVGRRSPIDKSEHTPMIELTRLNGHPLLVNSDLIKHAEAIPDTTLTLVTGEKLVVLESCADVLTRSLLYRASVMKHAWPSAIAAASAHQAFNSNS